MERHSTANTSHSVRLAVALGLLAICADGMAEGRPASGAEMKALTSAMSGRLKDADSAKYIDVRISKDATGDVKTICGKMNARNAYGGYVGFESFYGTVAKDGSVHVSEIDSGLNYPAAQYKCYGLGLYVGELKP